MLKTLEMEQFPAQFGLVLIVYLHRFSHKHYFSYTCTYLILCVLEDTLSLVRFHL